MEKQFTISEDTAKLLEVYRTFNEASTAIYEYLQGGTIDEVSEEAAREADKRFAPYSSHVEAIKALLLSEVGNRVAWSLSEKGATSI